MSSSESSYDYESDSDFTFDFTLTKESKSQTYEKFYLRNLTIENLVNHWDVLDKKKADYYWKKVLSPYLARSHWRKYAYKWLGEKYKKGKNYGRRIGCIKSQQRGKIAQEKFQKTIGAYYRKLFLLRFLNKDIALFIWSSYLNE